MEEKLKQLADKLGISTTYSDGGLARKEYEIPDSTVRFIAESLNADVGWDQAAQKVTITPKG